MGNFYKGKDILVAGGSGLIGSGIIRQLLKYDVKRVRSLDINESGQFHLNEELKSSGKLRILIGNIRDRGRLRWAMKGVDIVFNAAALKNVPMCEYNPFEAVATNVYGTQNLIDAAREEGVERLLSISTDKAVNPINTMGATKLLSEKLVMAAPRGEDRTIYSCVRFGNVLDQRDSVAMVFLDQIRAGGPVTLTSKEMVRFFILLHDAVDMILKAGLMMEGREVFIPRMDALKITDLAEVMIEEFAGSFGHRPAEIKIELTGLRPGEKLHESLLAQEELAKVRKKDGMFVVRSGVLTPHYVSEEPPAKPVPEEEYETRKARTLSKDEIKRLLGEKVFAGEAWLKQKRHTSGTGMPQSAL